MGGWDDGGFPRIWLGTVPLALIAIAAAFACGGCIWLAIPSLGYEYEKTDRLPGVLARLGLGKPQVIVKAD
jgi:hypothetical protein